MDQTKPWWASTTIWANLVTAVLGVLVAAGVVSQELSNSLGMNLETLLGVAFTLLGGLGVYTRATATKQIGTKT